MAGVNDKAAATSKFDVVVQKQRSLLTPEERRVIALGKAASGAAYQAAKAAEAAAGSVKRAEAAKQAADKAQAEFAAAKAALEAK